MQELSLHILDLFQNSLQAGATVISLYFAEDYEENTCVLRVEDNGSGLHVDIDVATDPFYTTKLKKTGLGLGWFRETVEQAGGVLSIGTSRFGGALVAGTMRLRHINRLPMGNLAGTVSAVASTNPDVDFQVTLVNGTEAFNISSKEIAESLEEHERSSFMVGRVMYEELSEAVEKMKLVQV